MKITLGAKELEKIVGAWATDRYDAGIPSVKIVKKRDSIDVIIDYTGAETSETLCTDSCGQEPEVEDCSHHVEANDSEEAKA